jgi:hypothetical protein
MTVRSCDVWRMNTEFSFVKVCIHFFWRALYVCMCVCVYIYIYIYIYSTGGRGGAVGWGTALQIGRLRVRFPMCHWNPPPLIGSRQLWVKHFPYLHPSTSILGITSTLNAYEDGTSSKFRNVGTKSSDADRLPKRQNTAFNTRRKFEIKNNSSPRLKKKRNNLLMLYKARVAVCS